MKQEWMDQPVLCIFDTRQIQAFMFRANSYYDTLGGSDLMLHILNDAISSALKSVDPPLVDDEFDLSDDPDGNNLGITIGRILQQTSSYGDAGKGRIRPPGGSSRKASGDEPLCLYGKRHSDPAGLSHQLPVSAIPSAPGPVRFSPGASGAGTAGSRQNQTARFSPSSRLPLRARL